VELAAARKAFRASWRSVLRLAGCFDLIVRETAEMRHLTSYEEGIRATLDAMR
jgi:hypothetical protein